MNPGGMTPKYERLAAYADGELHGPDRAAVEAWLDACPQARAEVEALRHLACQCRRTAGPEPAPEAWDAVLNNLHKALAPAPRRLPVRRPAARSYLPAAGAAAAIVAGLFVGRAFWPNPPENQPVRVTPATLTGPLHLADARDVDIISIDGDDTDNLLVATPPVRGSLKLAGPGDVVSVGFEQFEGVVPDFRHDSAPVILPLQPADAP
jgi:hypothetical protein